MVNVEVPRETNLLYILSVTVETKITKNRIFLYIYIYIYIYIYMLHNIALKIIVISDT